MENEDKLLSFSRFGVHYVDASISFGAMDTGGLIYRIDHMHERDVLSTYFSPPKKTTKVYGSSFSSNDWSLFTFGGKRIGGGGTLQGRSLGFSFIFASSGEDKRTQVDPLLRRDRSTLYLLGSYKGNHLEMSPCVSMTEDLLVSSFLKTKVSLHNMFISLSCGRLQEFLTDGDDYRSSYSFGMEKAGASFSYAMYFGRNPIYSYEYRTYKADWTMALDAFSFRFRDHVTKAFQKGKEKRRETVTVEYGSYTFSYSSESGASLSILLGKSRIQFSRSSFSVETVFSKSDSLVQWQLTVSSESVFDVKITIKL
ncbi:MAG: hypothetical protein KBS81_04570 [Spirochaetales bacterium]|nr:hypothetical protein [Candidatus Physcosoma equi]